MLAALLACSLIFGLSACWVFRRERLALYHPLVVFFLWHAIGYLYFPWKLNLNQDFGYLLLYRVPLNNDLLLVKTLLLVHAGFLAVILGYFSRWGVCWSNRFELPAIAISPRVALMVGLFTLALASYAILRFLSVPGIHHATATYLTKDDLGRGIYTGATGYVVLAPDFLIGIGLIWYLVLHQEKTRSWQCLFWGLALLYLFYSITKGYHRSAWVAFLLGLLISYLLIQHRRWPTFSQTVRLIPLAVVALLIFNISGMDRGAWRKVIEQGSHIQRYADPAIHDLDKFKLGYERDMSNFEYNVFQVSIYPDEVAYELGRIYINSWFVAALPRVLFPDKDKYFLPTNISRSNLMYFSVGPTAGLYLDLYCNFGIPGLIFGCFLFGIALRVLWQFLLRYEYSTHHQYVALLFTGFVTFLPQLLRDGLPSIACGYFFIMSPILITVYLSWRYSLRLVSNSHRRKGHLKGRPSAPAQFPKRETTTLP
jgi:hypothetical protein